MAQPSILELTGRIDNATSADIEARIGSVLDGAPSALVLDLAGVTFVSSIGLRVLLQTAKRCNKQNARLALHSVPQPIVGLFGVSGLTPIFPMYDSREAALAAIA
jgi:anti-sigma B factor antagonist